MFFHALGSIVHFTFLLLRVVCKFSLVLLFLLLNLCLEASRLVPILKLIALITSFTIYIKVRTLRMKHKYIECLKTHRISFTWKLMMLSHIEKIFGLSVCFCNFYKENMLIVCSKIVGYHSSIDFIH